MSRHVPKGAQATVGAILLSDRLNISGAVTFGQNVCLMLLKNQILTA